MRTVAVKSRTLNFENRLLEKGDVRTSNNDHEDVLFRSGKNCVLQFVVYCELYNISTQN